MRIHPQIQQFIKKINKTLNSAIDEGDIRKLKEAGATATEAAITLHLGFNYSLENAETYIHTFDLFPSEECRML
jgi:hypothetical protein